MIHQDEHGVLFQATDKQTGHLVALRRFFLSEEVVAKLKECDAEGQTLFDKGLDWMKSLEIPHLQKVIGGGFDELDGTPYFVTQWLEGSSLAEGFENESFRPGEGKTFEEQAKGVLLALPMESRPVVFLDEEEILVSRDDAGGLVTHFLISPLRYFGGMGGMEFEAVDRGQTLQQLAAKFPAAEVSAPATSQVAPASQTPTLKSAKQGSGGGLLWGSLAALLVLLGVGGWLVSSKSKSKDEEPVVAELSLPEESTNAENKPKEVIESESESQLSPEPAVAPESEVVSEEDVRESTPSEIEIAEARVARAQQELEESQRPKEMPAPRPDLYEIDESKPEGEISIFDDEDAPSTPEDGVYGPNDIEQLVAKKGEKVRFAGKVVSSEKSGSGKTWYLEFGDRRTQAFISFLQSRSGTDDSREDWDAFVGKEVQVEGKVEVDTGLMKRGSGVKISIAQMSEVKVKPEVPEERVYEYSDLDDLRVVSEGEEILFVGTLASYKPRNSSLYLFFEEGFAIVGRISLGDTQFNQALNSRLQALQGQRIQLRGNKSKDENQKIKIAIQFSSPDQVSLAN